MALSFFDLFTVGIGPSSSHTVGPMRAARAVVQRLRDQGLLAGVTRVQVDLYGSLGSTGVGHHSDRAVLLGLLGERPESVDPVAVDPVVAAVRRERRIALLGEHSIGFDPATDLILHRRRALPQHPNGMRFRCYAGDDTIGSVRSWRGSWARSGRGRSGSCSTATTPPPPSAGAW